MMPRRLTRWSASVLPLAFLALYVGVNAACSTKKVPPPPSVTLELRPGEGLIMSAPPMVLTGAELTMPGLLLPRNDDDSDSANGLDYTNTSIDGPDDERQLAQLRVKKLATAPAAGEKLQLRKKSGSGHVRVFRKEATWSASNSILDTSSAAATTAAESASSMSRAKAADTSFYVEGKAGGDVELCAAWLASGGATRAETCTKLEVRDNFGPVVFSDHDRNGAVAAAADKPKRRSDSALLFVNMDRDCPLGPAGPDINGPTVACPADEGDLAHLTIDVSRLAGAPAVWKPVLRIQDAHKGFIRIFNGTASGSTELAAVARMVAGVSYREMDISAQVAAALGGGASELTLGIEGREFLQTFPVRLCVAHSAPGIDAACDEARLETTRLQLQTNLEQVAKVVVVERTGAMNNTSMRTDLATLPVGATLDTVTSGSVWIQDEVEILGLRAPRGKAQAVVNLPRTFALHVWAAGNLDADVAYVDYSGVAAKSSPNFGGNLEVTPKSAAANSQIVAGNNMGPALVTQLEKVTDQKPVIRPNVGWLSVGHVDEAVAFYKLGASWAAAVADTSLAMARLGVLAKHKSLFWHCRTAGRTRAAACFGEGTITAATDKASGAVTLTAAGFTFNARPAGREWQWIRIYSGTGRGQIAQIKAIVSATKIELEQVWNLPTPDMTRCAATSEDPGFCDLAATGLGAPAGAVPFWPVATFRKDDWFTLPVAGDKFVVVEDTLDWDPGRAGTGSSGGGGLKRGVPALMTAGELADAGVNAAFHTKQTKINTILDTIATTIAAVPGATVKRIPGLYNSVASGATIIEGEAYVPGVVNFQVVAGTGATQKIFAARPFGPADGSTDDWESECDSKLGLGAGSPKYTDDWDVYHVNMGEVHCGTNLFRTDAREWWKP